MDLLFVVSTGQGADILTSLAQACIRKGAEWGCFFTNDGVHLLADSRVLSLMAAASPALACEHSWQRFMAGKNCPVELGSQTNHSALLATASRVVAI
ncbi:MAG: hypothetical protein K8F27_13090 [Sulfuricellaceae bacterium]|nr:hypothetical protein [Sulfuricellaceae bacterium]